MILYMYLFDFFFFNLPLGNLFHEIRVSFLFTIHVVFIAIFDHNRPSKRCC